MNYYGLQPIAVVVVVPFVVVVATVVVVTTGPAEQTVTPLNVTDTSLGGTVVDANWVW